MNMRKKQVPRHPGEQLLGAKVLGGAVGGGLKNLAGQLFDGEKGVDFKQVGKAALGGAAGQVPLVGGMLQNKIAGGGQQQAGQPGQAAPGLPGQQQPGQGLLGMIQQAHGGMVDYSAGGPTPEQLAEASQILANMGKEEKIAKYGMMSDEAILQEIARGLDGGEAAPTPDQPESKAGDRAYFEDKVVEDPRFPGSEMFNMTQHQADKLESARDLAREEAIKEGGSRSLAQAAYDELSQIGMGLRGVSKALDNQMRKSPYGRGEYGGRPADPSTAAFPDVVGAFRDAYGREEDADRARMESGAKGMLDVYNPLTMAKDFFLNAETDGLNQAAFSPSRGMEFVRSGIESRRTPVRKQFAGGRVKLRKRY